MGREVNVNFHRDFHTLWKTLGFRPSEHQAAGPKL